MPSVGETPGNGTGEGRLPMVDVANGTDVDMGFLPFKLFLSHREPPLLFFLYSSSDFPRYSAGTGA